MKSFLNLFRRKPGDEPQTEIETIDMRQIDLNQYREFIQAVHRARELQPQFEKTLSERTRVHALKGDDQHTRQLKADAHNAHWQVCVDRDNAHAKIDDLLKKIDFYTLSVAIQTHNCLCQYS